MNKVYTIWEAAVSVNEMTKGKKILTEKYRDFKTRAALEIAFQKPVKRKGKNISVKVTFFMKELYRKDVDGGIKAVLDACTEAGCWEDDRYIETLILKKVKSDVDKVEIEILN